jgi:hypothetical protein
MDLGSLKRFSTVPDDFRRDFHGGARTYYTLSQPTDCQNSQNSQKSAVFGSIYPHLSPNCPHPGDNFKSTRSTYNGLVEEELEDLPYENEYTGFPAPFAAYKWPAFLQRILDCVVLPSRRARSHVSAGGTNRGK